MTFHRDLKDSYPNYHQQGKINGDCSVAVAANGDRVTLFDEYNMGEGRIRSDLVVELEEWR